MTILQSFVRTEDLLMILAKPTLHLMKALSALSASCVFLTATSAKAQEARWQNVTGEGFGGVCTIDGSVSIYSGSSFLSTIINSTHLPTEGVQVHSTQQHQGYWSWITVGDVDGWVESDRLYDCVGVGIRSGMPYAQAREFILSQGWLPVESDPPSYVNSGYNYLKSLGFTEVIDCSGTGSGFCALRFYNTRGEVLGVTTIRNAPRSDGVEVAGWRRISLP